MTMQALIQAILEVPLFKGLKAPQIIDIVNAAERVIYQPGQSIAQRPTVSRASVIIVSGQAVRVQGPELDQGSGGQPDRISTGSMVGELAMFIDVEHFSTVLAETQVRALRLTQAVMHGLMERDPELADHFVSQISSQLTVLAHEMRAIDNALQPSAVADPFGQVATRPRSPLPYLH